MVTAPDRLTLPDAPPRSAAAGRVFLALATVLPLVAPLVWTGYRLSPLPDPVRSALSPLEAPWSVRDPLGLWALLLGLLWFGLAYRAERRAWWELLLLLLGAAIILPRVGNAW